MNTLIIIALVIILLFAAVFIVYCILQATSPEALKIFFDHDDDAEKTEHPDFPENR